MSRHTLALIIAAAATGSLPLSARACDEHASNDARSVLLADARGAVASKASRARAPLRTQAFAAANSIDPLERPKAKLLREAEAMKHAAKDSCASAAECARKPKRQVLEALKGQAVTPELPGDAHQDASAGLRI